MALCMLTMVSSGGTCVSRYCLRSDSFVSTFQVQQQQQRHPEVLEIETHRNKNDEKTGLDLGKSQRFLDKQKY